MDFLDDFLAANPGASYEDFIKMQDMMSQDIMGVTLPQVDLQAFNATVSGDMRVADSTPMMHSPVIDMFGNPHFVDTMDVDLMSGLPSSEFHCQPVVSSSVPSFTGNTCESYDQMRLDKGNEIEAMRDTAVQHYKEAKASGNIEEMLKWEAEANKQQGRLYDHWGTPTYGLPPKAPGIS